MKTINVSSVVEVFKNYLEDDSFIFESEKAGNCIYYYTDNYNGKMSAEWYAEHDRWKHTGGITVKKVTELEHRNLKKEDLEFRYSEVLKGKREGTLSIDDLEFLRLYEYYKGYENGEYKLSDEIDIVEGIIGCDKNRDEYYVDGMDGLFKNCVNAMYDGFGWREEGRSPINFPLFPDNIIDDYFEIDEWGFSDGYSRVTSREEMDYEALSYAAEDYLDSMIYDLSYIKFGLQKSNKHTIIELLRDCKVYEKLEGSDIYKFIDFEKYKEAEKLAEALLHNFFFDIRSKCLEALINNRENEAFLEKYRGLSMDDFRMNENMELEIINNQEFYRECGVENVKMVELENDKEREL